MTLLMGIGCGQCSALFQCPSHKSLRRIPCSRDIRTLDRCHLLPVHATQIRTAQVRVGQARGYSVAIAQHGDVGYAVASDLDAESNAELVAKADRE